MKPNQHKPPPESVKSDGRPAQRQGSQPLPARAPQPRSLRFTPYSWAKLLWFRDHDGCGSPTEIGGFGLTDPKDPLLVQDILVVRQTVTVASVKFDDLSVADLFESQIDQGRRPEHFARIWLHTHPGDSPQPSGVDEETFRRVFGTCDWAIMAIVARGGQSYARLRFNAGPGGDLRLPMQVDFDAPFPASDAESWREEYQRNISLPAQSTSYSDLADDLWPDQWAGLDETCYAQF